MHDWVWWHLGMTGQYQAYLILIGHTKLLAKVEVVGGGLSERPSPSPS